MLMNITLKRPETAEEIRGRAYVHWRAWHEAYQGIVSPDYLNRLTLEKCEQVAFSLMDGCTVAKDGNRIIGFVSCGGQGEEHPETGEVFAIYVLAEYYGTGVGRMLMNTALEQLKDYPRICVHVLKGNVRAIRFYEKCGFIRDGEEQWIERLSAPVIRMILQ